ncbi:conserved hypothetical protein [Sporisorium reilianum SRZ2]|uniref:Uncharacterized protein n=1 Tax=Sporisorium reilianum (strain SRZ2) TaxID=999809 RepID=E6ZTN1_SPORE|nr:conserved hypothetical protein [Sporisorium reilianum SRZ2]
MAPQTLERSSGADAPVAAPAIATTSSSNAIPTYPTTDVAQPSASTGILNADASATAHSSAAASTTAAARPRVSLSYPAERPPRDRSGGNASGAADAHDDTAEDSARPSRSRSAAHSHRRSQSAKRSLSQSRTSLDAAASKTGGAIRRSMSLIRPAQSSAPIDPMQEPRRSISKRPDELHLAERDPHTAKHVAGEPPLRRAIPFAAPYARSGVVIDQPATLRDWIVPGPLTFGYGQWWYLVCGQSIVAALISGAINFGVAVALYHSQPTINIWTFDRQTVAGDMGVTVIIQQIVSFVITSSLVHHDLYAGPIGPLRRPWPPLLHLPSTPRPEGHWLGARMPEDVQRDKAPCRMGRSEGKSRKNGWWWWFVRAVLTGSERNDLLAAGISWRQRLERLVWTAAQGFFLCCLTFWWYWPLAIAIVAPIYEHRELAHTWVPMIIKLLFGAILSLLTNPLMALMAMGAESSVRRCYPELDMWGPFGGREDFAQWKVEHGVVDAAELGEAESPVVRSAAASSDEQDVGAAEAAEKGAYQSGSLLVRRITEEPNAAVAREGKSG